MAITPTLRRSLIALLLLICVAVVIYMASKFSAGEGKDEPATCARSVDKDCTDLAPEVIAEYFGFTLPEGTVIEESQLVGFQDDYVEATFVVPAAQVSQWEASLEEYEPETDVDCQGLEGQGPRTCAKVSAATEHQSYTRVTLPDGSVRVHAIYFET